MVLCMLRHDSFEWNADSSEALMAGRKPPMQLVVRVVNDQNHVITDIPPLLSEAFVVRASAAP